MDTHPNADLVQKALAAIGDEAATRTFWSTDLVLYLGGRHQLAGTYRGLDELTAAFAKSLDLGRGTIAFDPIDVLAGDRHVVLIVRATGERDGNRLDQRHIWAMRLDDDRLFDKAWCIFEDPEQEDRFWGSG